jgi:drug/metabolite transporter (DMT)-like permease
MGKTGSDAASLKARQASGFFRKGVTIAVMSGVLYGIYSACLLAATGSGEWVAWYEGYVDGAFTNLAVTFLMGCLILGALGSGINDFISAVWMVGKAAAKGKLGDLCRCLKSRPGAVMIACALIGGPVASTAYLIALTMAGPVATPVSALCPAVGALIGRLFFRQRLNARIVAGILICVTATFMIGSTAFGELEIDTMFLTGLLIALVAAIGWGVEGAVAGFGTSVMDFEIAIAIRQLTSGIATLFILLPILFLMAPGTDYMAMLSSAFGGDMLLPGTWMLGAPVAFFLISGLAAGLSFGYWYKGNSMCGAALGMACNGGFSFWVPFFSFLICGLYLGWGFNDGALDPATGYVLTPVQWLAAVVMVAGIFLIAVNPLEWLRRAGRGTEGAGLAPSAAPAVTAAIAAAPASPAATAAPAAPAAVEAASAAPLSADDKRPSPALPLNYAVLRLFANGLELDTQAVMDTLAGAYSSCRAFNPKSVLESLMSAEKNGLLEESRFEADGQGGLKAYYRSTEYGRDMIGRYIR